MAASRAARSKPPAAPWSARFTARSGAITYSLLSNAIGTYGQLLLHPDGSYTYTLTSPASTMPQANDGANTLHESFTYQATDAQGNVATSTIVINIVDDVPTAIIDHTSVGEGGYIGGNVLWNDNAGADGQFAGGGVVGVRAGARYLDPGAWRPEQPDQRHLRLPDPGRSG